uniref:WRKY transcription factor n=1 Tax=Fagopyrum tataricum TaxID=62330 RepID=A0A4P9Q2V1_FAGTA|nr:WRKY transcription factor [Fagopyrum tataricum]
MAENDGVSSSKQPPRPTIALPPRSSMDSLFGSGGFGASPGPMTLVSNFFTDTDPESDCRSFSQLLAGAIVSPAGEGTSSGVDMRFKQSRPTGLMVTQPQLFTIPPGLSPASLLESPGLFPSQSPFGMSHQQALPQVTSRVQHQHQHQSSMYMLQGSLPTSLSMNTIPASMAPFTSMHQDLLAPAQNSTMIRSREEYPHFLNPDERPQPSSIVVDKPADDGYNWRKYGQKQVKGSEFPRSYYKCTHPSCPVKKLVERSVDGQVTEIIYKGQHNHAPPQSNKRGKESNLNLQNQTNDAGLAFSLGRRDPEASHGAGECLSSSEDVGEEGDDGESDAKRRSLEGGMSEPGGANHRTVTEPRIIVQTTSEVDLLEDGYRWRKYGQKVVKGNPYPRSYYKCTHQGCNVRKHIERASADPKAVITTYEGKHTHDVPAPRASSHNTNASQPPPRPFGVMNQNQNQNQNQSIFLGRPDFSNDNHQSVTFLQLKEERIS